MSNANVRYLLFDIESVADGDLISKIVYPDQELSAEQAIQTYAAERMEKYGTEFIPYTFHIPVAVSIIKISKEFDIVDIVSLDEGKYRPHVITKNFWDGWKAYREPTLISFNGRTFDIPLMELAAFRYGVNIGDWFRDEGPSYEQPRNRYNNRAHIDGLVNRGCPNRTIADEWYCFFRRAIPLTASSRATEELLENKMICLR